MKNEERIERINAMRAMLDFVEANPDMRMPYDLHLSSGWSIYTHDLEAFLGCVEAFGVAPTIEDGNAIVAKHFGPFRVRASFTLDELDEPERFRKEVPSIAYEWDADAFLRAVMDAKDVPAEV
jgi:hypothetical protein